MPRDGSGIYTLPAAYQVANGDVSSASQHNTPLEDLQSDANAARPVVAGGTGASTASGARTNLDVYSKAEVDAAIFDGYLTGLGLSNNATDATNDIDITAGSASHDGSPSGVMNLASGITKRIDSAWAVGTNQGGLDTGTVADGTYFMWLIKRSDTGVVDALFSLSASSPTMPTNYDQKRRIGAILRESGAIVGFSQTGDVFIRNEFKPAQISGADVAGTNIATAQLATFAVPVGIKLEAMISVTHGSPGGGSFARYTDPDVTDVAVSTTNYMALSIGTQYTTWSGRVVVDTSARIRLAATQGGTLMYATAQGWVDRRGK